MAFAVVFVDGRVLGVGCLRVVWDFLRIEKGEE